MLRLILLGAALASSGCVDRSPYDGQGWACPCLASYICDETTGLCMPPGSASGDGSRQAGDPMGGDKRNAGAPVGRVAGEVVLYLFNSPSGDTVRDRAAGVPLDLTIAGGSVTWSGEALTISTETSISHAGGATKVTAACSATDELSIEVWGQASQTGFCCPGRIVAVSGANTSHNFMLGQGSNSSYTQRLRTNLTGDQGGELTTGADAAGTNLRHIVFTRDASGSGVLYIDGVVNNGSTFGGNFSTWDPAFPLIIANEATGARPWLGSLHLVAVYDRALSELEVMQNFSAGADRN